MNAQFLFSQRSVEFIVRCIEEQGFKKVLCVGTPRLHEALNKRKKNKNKRPIDCLLLDIDHRLLQFYNTRKMCRYNMFNHHFFDGSRGSRLYKSFLSGEDAEKIVLVTDRVPKIESACIWNHPLEQQIFSSIILPNFWHIPMLNFFKVPLNIAMKIWQKMKKKLSVAYSSNGTYKSPETQVLCTRFFTKIDRMYFLPCYE